MANSGDEQVARILERGLQAESGDVRAVAMIGLAELLGDGHERVSSAALSLICDQGSDCHVRAAAVDVLGSAKAGDPHAVQALCAALQDCDTSVRTRAVEVMAIVVPRGNAIAASTANAALSHGSAGVRQRAADALAVVAEQGDARTIEALIE